ncbi:MAG: hypothetical protein ILA06_03045 [Bacteroidaceae bacterium]|nr:hypothetical protein [Bacteroidaceae bacterium]
MKRLLPILIVFLTALIGYRGDAMNAEVEASQRVVVSSCGRTYALTDPQPGRHHEAMLNDARGVYRLCNTRPGRLLPTHGAGSGKNAARSLAVRRSGIKHLFFLHDGRRRLETAPFQTAASRDYYVFALRRILC